MERKFGESEEKRKSGVEKAGRQGGRERKKREGGRKVERKKGGKAFFINSLSSASLLICLSHSGRKEYAMIQIH